jgi:hypothetical protein
MEKSTAPSHAYVTKPNSFSVRAICSQKSMHSLGKAFSPVALTCRAPGISAQLIFEPETGNERPSRAKVSRESFRIVARPAISMGASASRSCLSWNVSICCLLSIAAIITASPRSRYGRADWWSLWSGRGEATWTNLELIKGCLRPQLIPAPYTRAILPPPFHSGGGHDGGWWERSGPGWAHPGRQVKACEPTCSPVRLRPIEVS